jgi:hypothetical protein
MLRVGVSVVSNTAKGTAYEVFVQALYQTLHDADGFDDIKVEHNKTDLVGRSGCAHQIDVYWEFKIAGQVYRTAIECKALEKAVPIGQVRDFYGVLSDVPGLQGIFVSRFGFQSGAKKYADHYGIPLKEIRSPMEEDREGRIEKHQLRVFLVFPEITAFRPDVTQAYLNTLKPDEEVDASFAGTNYDPLIVDSAGNHVASHEEIRQQLPTDNQPATGLTATLSFPGCFLNVSNGLRIPIVSVTVKYDVYVERADVLGEQTAKAIMKDVSSGDIMFFHGKSGIQSVRG